jgi:DNA-binding beta-propeller fold protein YncE
MSTGGILAAESWAAELWVTNMKSANVQVFNPTTLKLITSIPADKGAHNVTFSPNGKLALIATRDDNKLLVVSAADLSVKAEVATDDEPHGVAYRK